MQRAYSSIEDKFTGIKQNENKHSRVTEKKKGCLNSPISENSLLQESTATLENSKKKKSLLENVISFCVNTYRENVYTSFHPRPHISETQFQIITEHFSVCAFTDRLIRKKSLP